MKRQIALLILICLAIASYGQDNVYRILYINTSEISIAGRKCHVGDEFAGRGKIKWTDSQQAMKVLDTATGRQSVVSASSFRKNKSSSLADYLSGSKHLSTRPGTALSLVDLRRELTGTQYLLDNIDVATTLPTGSAHFFFAQYEHDGEKINKRLASTDGHFVIDRELWTVDGQPIPVRETVIAVYYYDTATQQITSVTDELRIIPLVENIGK